MTPLVLRLYIAGNSRPSQRALENITHLRQVALRGLCEIEVIDVLNDPAQAEKEKILATPTLVKRLPEPVRKIIGDLSDLEWVLRALDLPRAI